MRLKDYLNEEISPLESGLDYLQRRVAEKIDEEINERKAEASQGRDETNPEQYPAIMKDHAKIEIEGLLEKMRLEYTIKLVRKNQGKLKDITHRLSIEPKPENLLTFIETAVNSLEAISHGKQLYLHPPEDLAIQLGWIETAINSDGKISYQFTTDGNRILREWQKIEKDFS